MMAQSLPPFSASVVNATIDESEILGLPVADPMRGGPEFQRLIEACLE
jgi:hypothetical protein